MNRGDRPVKVLLLGGSCAGKSCLLQRYTKNKWVPNYLVTIGVDFSIRNIELDGKNNVLQIWDTAGHEVFQTITRPYISDAGGVLILYSVTDRKSFEVAIHWGKVASELRGKNVPIGLVGQMCDIPKDQWTVSTEEGQKLAAELSMEFFIEVSAKDNVNVDQTFDKIVRAALLTRTAANEGGGGAAKPSQQGAVKPSQQATQPTPSVFSSVSSFFAKNAAEKKSTKPLAELTLSDVEALLSNQSEALSSSFETLSAVKMSGDVLMMVDSANELQDIGMQVHAARLLYSKLQGWKENGVELHLLVRKSPGPGSSPLPSPAPFTSSSSSFDPPPPPPNHASHSGPSSSRRVGSIRLVGSIETGGRRSSGDTVIMHGTLLLATSSIPIIAKVGRDQSLMQREHDIMSELFSTSGRHFIKPHGGVLSGASGDIVTERSEDDLTSRYAIVMEKGNDDLFEYLQKKHSITSADLLQIGSSLVDIVEAAHGLGYVMMDFKPQNVVRVYDGFEIFYKAIDFDSWRRSGDNVTVAGTTTPSIASPEMANLLLARHEGRTPPRTLASPASDIFALGLLLFYIGHNKRSFWKVLCVDESDPIAILKCSSSLTDVIVQGVLIECFREEKRRSLRTLLGDMLKVSPDKRYTATQLKTSHSFFGFVDPTFSASNLVQDMSKLATKGDVEAAKKDMNDGFQKIQLSLEEMHGKLNNLAMSQSELGTLMRQAAADAAENQGELKRRLEALAETMTLSLRDSEDCATAKELNFLIQSVVASSIEATSAMGEELKHFIRDTVVQCAENADRTSQAEQLRQIMETLVNLKDDVLNVASEINELRADLAKVNETLGSRLNVLHTMVRNEKHVKFSPITILIFPHHSKNVLKMVKNTFSSEYVIFFVCPVTKKVMKSGPKGRGYKFRVMNEWVKRVAPVLIMTLKICALAAAAYGVPLPIPALPGGSTTDSLVSSMVEDIGGIVHEKVEGWTAEQNEEREDAFDTAKSALKLCEGMATMSAAKRAREEVKLKLEIESTMGDEVYPTIRDLLKDLEGVKGQADEKWMPQHTGLKMVDCDVDGSTAWVSEEGEVAFKARGMAAILE